MLCVRIFGFVEVLGRKEGGVSQEKSGCDDGEKSESARCQRQQRWQSRKNFGFCHGQPPPPLMYMMQKQWIQYFP